MTSNTHRKPRRMRNSVMESLGFIETPSVSYVSSAIPQAATRPTNRPTRLVSRTGKHAVTVDELWQTTELEADSMADWSPVSVEKRLNKRLRWPLLVMWVLILGMIGAAAYLVYEAPTNAAANALTVVVDDAIALSETLEPLAQATASITPGAGDVSAELISTVGEVDRTSRDLFASAGGLPASLNQERSSASDAATFAIDATKTLNNLNAYLGAAVPVMTAPPLETDPELVDLATAATEFGEWASRFDAVRSVLPDSILSSVSAEMAILSGSLQGMQSDYLDALRVGDQEAVLAAVRALEGELAEVWALLSDETESVKQSILDRITAAQRAIEAATS